MKPSDLIAEGPEGWKKLYEQTENFNVHSDLRSFVREALGEAISEIERLREELQKERMSMSVKPEEKRKAEALDEVRKLVEPSALNHKKTDAKNFQRPCGCYACQVYEALEEK